MTLRNLWLGPIVAGSLTSLALLAATITEQSLSVPGLAGKPATVSRTLRVTGMIEEGDATRLRAVLTDMQKSASRTAGQPLTTVELSSLGGDLLEALKLGYLFREFDVATLVRAGDSCLSACALAFLGGTASHLPTGLEVERAVEVGGTLGFHNFYLNPNSEVANDASNPQEGIARGFNVAKGGAALLVHYAASLGVDPGFIARMLGRPSETWEYANSAGQFIELKICPIGISRPTPSPRTSAVNICTNSLGATAMVVPPQANRVSPTEAKRHLLDHVHKNVASFGVSGPLALQLAAVLASRDDRLVNSVYADLRAAGLSLPEIIGPTFEVKGFGAGVYDLQCVVSLSLDDPNRFDTVLVGPMGLAKPPQHPPASCGRLFSFDRGDVLNPEKR